MTVGTENGLVMKRIGIGVLWVLAATGTATLTHAAVTLAGNEVAARPATPVAASDVAARLAVPETVATSVAPATTMPDLPEVTVTSEGGAVVPPPVTTTVPQVSTTTTTAAATTTTAVAPSTEWKTVSGVGTVGVAVQGSAVSFVSASPVNPYRAEVTNAGPETVEVEFESEGSEFKVVAEVEGGVLVWRVIEEGDSGGSGDSDEGSDDD